jgi:hypothetical protein
VGTLGQHKDKRGVTKKGGGACGTLENKSDKE